MSNDEKVLRMLAGANFTGGAKLILPSGKELGADEAQAFTSLYADPDEVVFDHDKREQQIFLKHCRSACPKEYIDWLVSWWATGGEITHEYDCPMPSSFVVMESYGVIPSLYGAFSLHVIVPPGVCEPKDVPRTFHGTAGHSTFYFMDGPALVGSWVPMYSDTQVGIQR